ncbi:hypothetical protein PtA15_14A318 [Puccinia triticina]|uniref:CSC1/OSCA1-like 7TM region domain-containing protein n=1 Tax=Puccinia triticina TaxID=208348 RepID=A0ABY7D3P1_9BASI|nr:uncharacterized protein PtA15_14A318 [Puccinia triticina]WAQ91434.1 hypothetical protein PtA15_14A318 [Puccinia triticina]
MSYLCQDQSYFARLITCSNVITIIFTNLIGTIIVKSLVLRVETNILCAR